MFFLLASCNQADDMEKEKNFPFDLLDEDHGWGPFEIPEEWDVYQVSQYHFSGQTNRETQTTGNSEQREPIYASMSFGKTEDKNQADLDKIQREEIEAGSHNETLYLASVKDRYASVRTIRIEDAAETLAASLAEHTEAQKQVTKFEVNGIDVYAISLEEDTTPHLFTWASQSNDSVYELYIEGGFHTLYFNGEEDYLEQVVSFLKKVMEASS